MVSAQGNPRQHSAIGHKPDDSNKNTLDIATTMNNNAHDVQQMPGDIISQTPVEHLYLTFDTALPLPVGLSSPQSGQSDPPPCPDLSKYASPFCWSDWRKSVITMISCGVTAMSAYAAGEYTPPADELTSRWNVSRVVYNLGITLFCLGFGIAPMVLAPFSEINGRRPIFVSSGIVFTGQSTICVPWAFSMAILTCKSLPDWLRSDGLIRWAACCKVLPGYRWM